ncbi:MAG: hypothetical protein KDA61_02510 [Planctomycetales bacterium]|nr:hypothetical protein [Planctomycetales bacterium]
MKAILCAATFAATTVLGQMSAEADHLHRSWHEGRGIGGWHDHENGYDDDSGDEGIEDHLDEGGWEHGRYGGTATAERIDAAQSRLAGRYDDLTSTYSADLADISDYYASDEYVGLIADTETLSVRYDLFLVRAESTLARISDAIASLADRSTALDELLTQWQSNDALSTTILERMTTRVENWQTQLTVQSDYLLEQQSLLTTNLVGYAALGDDIDVFLADIVAAGTSDVTTDSSASASASALASVAAATAIPEPVSAALALAALLPLGRRRRR